MGLDIGFYTENEEAILAFRNHHGLLNRLLAQPHDKIEPYSDFHVTDRTIETILEDIEIDMEDLGLPVPHQDIRNAVAPENLCNGVPGDFCDSEPDNWAYALPHYHLLLTRLLAYIRAEGSVICGWSA